MGAAMSVAAQKPARRVRRTGSVAPASRPSASAISGATVLVSPIPPMNRMK